MLITKLYRAVSNYSVDYASEARKSTSSAMRLPRSLTMLNLTNHLSLSELDYAIRTQQADKAWSIFVNLSKQGDTIPLTICCSLYALLVYARSMLSRGRIVENRQYQMNQLLDYVQQHHQHTPELFLPFVQHIDIPLRKEIARLIRFEEPEKAWILFFKTHKEGKERLSRTLCIDLIILIINDTTLNQNQLNHRLRTIALHGAAKSNNDSRNILASDVLRIAHICRQYQRKNLKSAHRLVDEFVLGIPKKKKKNRADALDELIWTILMNKDLLKAQHVFDTVREGLTKEVAINEGVYINLMNAYRRQKDNLRALKLFEQYLESGCQPSLKGFNAILHLFALQKQADRAAFVFTTILSLDIEPDIVTYTEMIRAYARSGDYNKCMFFYNRMLESHLTPNVYTYGALIDASSRQQDIQGVLHWFQTMISNNIKPNEFTISLVLKSLSRQASKHTPQALHWIIQEAFVAGIKPDAVLYTALLKIQAEQLGLESALNVQKEMIAQSVEPNTYTYTTLISICGKYNVPETAQDIFELMKKSKRHQPNTATYTALINAWAKNNKFEQADALIMEFLTICKFDKTGRLWIDDKITQQIRWCWPS
ncbi:hypothetical protein G6F56_000597 [Rhizopus delemar]|nr:hypothetical protein G6F56_000597 [Rhizopus delemar]